MCPGTKIPPALEAWLRLAQGPSAAECGVPHPFLRYPQSPPPPASTHILIDAHAVMDGVINSSDFAPDPESMKQQ